MSLIGAVCSLRGGSVDSTVPSRMLAAGLLLRPARQRVSSEGMAALVVHQFAHALAEGDSPQPVPSRFGTCRVVLDGRIDNREALGRELQQLGASRHDATDAELLAGAYETWGPDCAARIHGELAWIVWDRKHHRLVGARDAFGLRPLYYARWHDRFVCSSQLDQVRAALPESAGAFSEEFLADFFARSYARPALTPYAAINRIPPAHRFILQHGQLTIERYWNLEDRDKIIFHDPRDYAQRFRELFEEAVRVQMRETGSVWADLSGGLDSSSITSVAARTLVGGRLPGSGAPFATLSWVAEASRGGQDRALQAIIAETYGLTNHRVSADEHHGFQDAVEAARHWDEPAEEIFSFALQREVSRLLARHNVTSVLRGVGAECVVLSELEPPLHLADLLRAGRLRECGREMRIWQRALGHPMVVLAERYAMRPFFRPRGIAVGEYRVPPTRPWLSRDFVKRADLHRRAREPWQQRHFASAADQWQYEQLVHLAGYNRPGCLHKSCEVRLPFLYRPLVEYSFAIPWRVKVQPGTYKQLLRDAMVDVVPEEVRTWKRKIGATNTAYRALDLEFGALRELLHGSRLHEAGIIDVKRLERHLDLLRVGAEQFTTGLLRPLAIEAWLRAQDSTKVTADAVRASV